MPVIAQVGDSNSNQAVNGVNEVRTFSKARVMNVGHLLMGFEYAYKHSELLPFTHADIGYDKEKKIVKIETINVDGSKSNSTYKVISSKRNKGKEIEYMCTENVTIIINFTRNRNDDSVMIFQPDEGFVLLFTNRNHYCPIKI